MRLSEDQIKRGVLHPDPDVREAAVEYFSGSYSPDPSMMPLVIQAIEQNGWNAAFRDYSFLEDLAQTDETVRWLVGELRRLGRPENERAGEYADWLSAALAHADAAVLQRHEVEVEALEELDDESREALDERLTFLSAEP